MRERVLKQYDHLLMNRIRRLAHGLARGELERKDHGALEVVLARESIRCDGRLFEDRGTMISKKKDGPPTGHQKSSGNFAIGKHQEKLRARESWLFK